LQRQYTQQRQYWIYQATHMQQQQWPQQGLRTKVAATAAA
jgi:hypothetical protein